MPQKYVIIGGDAAGMSAASKIRRLQPEAEMVVFEKGKYISFAACGIPYWIGGIIEDGRKLQVLTPKIAREKRDIDVRIHHEVIKINPPSKTVTVRDIKSNKIFETAYDKLLIATGARAALPAIPGIEQDGVYTLRTLGDGNQIQSYLQNNNVKHATVIGAGYIGVEMAENLRHLGLAVTMIGIYDQIVPTFDKDILEQVQEHIIEQGVDLKLNTQVTDIDSSNQGLVVKSSAGDVETDLVIVSTGVNPNTELARDVGIKLGSKGAILINELMQTSDPDIYAAGDCCEHHHLVLDESIWIPLATSANKGGRIAGENMAGGSVPFPGILGTAVIKIFDYNIAQTGLSEKQARATDKYSEIDTVMITGGSKAHYYPGSTPVTVKMVVDKSSKRLLGAQIIGKSDVAKRLDVLATAITAKMTVADVAMLDLTYAPPVAPVYDPIHVAANVANK